MQLNQNNVLRLIQVNHIVEFWIWGKDLKEKKQKRKELIQCNKFQFLNIEIAINRNKHLYKQFYALIYKRELFCPKIPCSVFP